MLFIDQIWPRARPPDDIRSDHCPGKGRRRADSDGRGGSKPKRRRKEHTVSTLEAFSDRQDQHSSVVGREDPTPKANSIQPSGHFHYAHDFVLHNPHFVENMFSAGSTVLERLGPYTMPSAAMDSSARHPPKCHPGTRVQIGKKLAQWLDDNDRQWNMVWLFGSAGTGKSAVAQTFAESCSEKRRHGASYFFSRPHKRNKTETVIPTLAYQLAVHCQEYKSILTAQFAEDLQLLEKAPDVQLRKLIVEPFARLQNDSPSSVRGPFVIILDGLDECEEEKAQCDLVKMISEAVRMKKGLPLLWLICSRPEAHLKHLFSRIPKCGREELFFDAETRDDVERYVRAEFARIKAEDYLLATLSLWPPEEQLQEILRAVSGLFVFAATVVKYVENSTDPAKMLDSVVSYLKRAREVGTTNPLAGLDLLYMQILNDVPDEIFPTTWRILAHFIYLPQLGGRRLWSTQRLCNFLDIDRHTFYSALRKVYSVVDVPGFEDAAEAPLRFYHSSFEDFLLDPSRSGKFLITRQRAFVDITKSLLFWYSIDTAAFHTNDGWHFDHSHNHDGLPGLKWCSRVDQKAISLEIASFTGAYYSSLFGELFETEQDEELLSQVYNFDFRYARRSWGLCDMANWIHWQDPSNTFVRTEPSSKVDFRLLEYMKVVTNGKCVKPAKLPIIWMNLKVGYSKYFFIGRGEKSAIVWAMQGYKPNPEAWLLNANREPSDRMISLFEDTLKRMEWPVSRGGRGRGRTLRIAKD